MENQRITVGTTIPAGIDLVWECWTAPRHIIRWNQASDDWHCPGAENDLRPGGSFRSRMESKDGQHGFDFEGTYDEVEEGRKISYTMADGRKVEVLFRPEGSKTHVTETFDPESTHSHEMQRSGWQAILDNFSRYVQSL